MIWHFLEVWFVLTATFAVGCGLGASLYAGLSRSPLATAQGVVADAIGDVVDEIKLRLGVGPDWRPAYRPPAERPASRARGDAVDDELPITAAPPSWGGTAAPPQGEWADDAEWEEDESEAYEGIPVEEAGEGDAATAPPPQTLPPPPEDTTMMRPAGLVSPRSGIPDNLQRIRGIGRRNEELLHGLGIFHFGQIAAWTPAEMRWVAARLAFPERIERDDWIGQAIILASGGETEYVKAVAERQKAAEGPEGGT